MESGSGPKSLSQALFQTVQFVRETQSNGEILFRLSSFRQGVDSLRCSVVGNDLRRLQNLLENIEIREKR